MVEMKIAVIEKFKTGYSDPFAEYFNFDYDRLELTNSKKTKILKRDITLKEEDYEDYDYVILIGKEPCKFIGKVSNVTKFAGQLVNDKYIPMINPIAVKFNPGIKNAIDGALKKLHSHIDGSYEEVLGIYEGITCARRAKEWLRKALHATFSVLVVDIETSSLYPREGYVLGIALSYEEKTGVYIDSECIDDEIETLLAELFLKNLVVFHGGKFDMKWLNYHFNFIFPQWDDTMLEHYLLNENEAHDLKYLAIKYTKMGEYDAELEKFKKDYMKAHGVLVRDFSYELIPFEIMWKYAAADADATLRLYNKFNPIIKEHYKRLYGDIMQRGTQFLLEIEEIGIPFSRDYLERANKDLSERIFNLTEKLYEWPIIKEIEQEQGKKFNPGSPDQLRVLFFDKLNLPTSKMTDGGLPSTDKDVLVVLSELHEIPKIVGEIRGLVKMRSTYITKVLGGMDNDDRLRTSFHLHTVTSGRLSSSGKLNAQQMPRDDKTVKYCIRTKDPENRVIFSQDLKTAEMYYAAVLSGDKNLAIVFKQGEDFHNSVAKMTFGLTCPVDEVGDRYPELRQAAKAISFGILYGAGAGKVSRTANIPYTEAEDIIKRYFGKFVQLKTWIDTTQTEIKNNGFIYSYFGRKRRVPKVFSVDDYEQGHAVRSAMNFLVQSVASDINLLAAIDAHNHIKVNKLPIQIFGLVHDSIIGETDINYIHGTEFILKKATQLDRGVSIPGCPIRLDWGYGESYGHAV